MITFNFNRKWQISKSRLFYQPFGRDDELKLINVYAANDQLDFPFLKKFDDLSGIREEGKWVDLSLMTLIPKRSDWSPSFRDGDTNGAKLNFGL